MPCRHPKGGINIPNNATAISLRVSISPLNNPDNDHHKWVSQADKPNRPTTAAAITPENIAFNIQIHFLIKPSNTELFDFVPFFILLRCNNHAIA